MTENDKKWLKAIKRDNKKWQKVIKVRQTSYNKTNDKVQ